MDFLKIETMSPRKKAIVIFPDFRVNIKGSPPKDLMIKGGDFYAVWDDERKLWSTSEAYAEYLIDCELEKYYNHFKEQYHDIYDSIQVLYMSSSDSGMVDKWHKYVQKQLRDSYIPLNERLIFMDMETKREDYASKKLPYALNNGKCDAYNEMIGTLYSPEERHKIEWAIGSIVSGESVHIQKFMVFYGSHGTGKSTIIDLIEELFNGYTCAFDAKALGTASNNFALEPFRNNPLVAIQYDGDLSHIEDNTRLNSLISHEIMTVNEKFKSSYGQKFKAFLFMATNKPVKITDAKSGILRRLIDVSPTGNKIPLQRYLELKSQMKFELGSIAFHCREVFLENPNYYDDYVPLSMMATTNEFYNFMLDSYDIFKEQDETTLNAAWSLYNNYCEEAKVPYGVSKRAFKEELKNYFYYFEERATVGDTRVRNYYKIFRTDRFDFDKTYTYQKDVSNSWLTLDKDISRLDGILKDCPAQYANDEGTPTKAWANVLTSLQSLDTTRLHYVKTPENLIVIDFDIPDKNGNKSLELNLKAASKWPKTYAELSKSGNAIHLHYWYDGDVSKLRNIYDEHIEVKVFTGGSSLRRKLSKCNNMDISVLSSGLPLKEVKSTVNEKHFKDEEDLRSFIAKILRKEIMPYTVTSVSFLKKILDDAYDQGMTYDVSNLRPAVISFGCRSTNSSQKCLKMITEMKFKSKNYEKTDEIIDGYSDRDYDDDADSSIVFFDLEVWPNLFIVCWKKRGPENKVVKMINPSPIDILPLFKMKLVGFNNRKYDNHILYARKLGYSNELLFNLSQRIIDGQISALFGEAYKVSYTDILDFSSKKQSLKKFEIELKIHHQEAGIPWDQPVPEELWDKMADYCANDVIASEATFDARYQDFVARKILAKLSGLTVNDTTRMHTTKIIFGDDKHPELIYTDLSTIFPGYSFSFGKSEFMGEDPSNGGYVYAEPGMYGNVALLDVESLHPTSIELLNLFGKYTKNFSDIKKARIYIKHKDYKGAGKLMNGALKPFLSNPEEASNLSQALKIVINSVYGYTTASFDNPFKDPRNVDNIVAKRGALFMILLKHEVQSRGYTVAHIKTDSIKIPDADDDIIQFVMDFGHSYGYNFEHEATYDRLCLVNDAVYIAKYNTPHLNKDTKKEEWWTATGTQFQVPFVFKNLFSREPIEFDDFCETKAVNSNLYLDFNENLPEGEHDYKFVGKIGQFTPILPGKGGGVLYREKDGKYNAATGTKGYRWKESEVVRCNELFSDIDKSYYFSLADAAVDTISKYGDFNLFVGDNKYVKGMFT